MNQWEENHEDGLSLFTAPPTSTGLHRREWITFRPNNQITDGPLEFYIPPQSSSYMDLKRSTIKVKLRIVDGDGKPIGKDANVGLTNLALQSIFSDIECGLQQTSVADFGSSYPYKAYIDTLLETSKMNKVERQSQLYFKDRADYHDDSDARLGSNTGLYLRSKFTEDGRIVELEGPLHLDVFRQNRLILNGIPLRLKLWPTKDAFRLMSNMENAAFKVHILDASFKLCLQTPNAGVLMAHNKLLGETTAMYPYIDSQIKIASASKGEYGFMGNNLFLGDVPSQLIVVLVSSESFSGSYKKSPFHFQGYDCNFLSLYVDGHSYPSQPLQPNFSGENCVDAYRTLARINGEVDIEYKDFMGGMAIYVLDIDEQFDFNHKRRGDCRLELKFGTPLPESVTVLMYGKFPRVMRIDQSRRVML